MKLFFHKSHILGKYLFKINNKDVNGVALVALSVAYLETGQTSKMQLFMKIAFFTFHKSKHMFQVKNSDT